MTSIIRCMQAPHVNRCFFFFNDTATTEIYTLSLHDALPISELDVDLLLQGLKQACAAAGERSGVEFLIDDSRGSEKRSEEHTSELQSRPQLVCRLLLEKKKTTPCSTTRTLRISSATRQVAST